ncbi:HdeD family acid-resistance protein [Allobaculum mucilyticum]|uniref:HdeD family acid-resistance protein n=1 Tax=Allobaculum mucilyticum TaxID=2834459 RepID=UPI001E54BC90|nr:DUF308 domain-containing protein [Allobaculum mucilyticum]UNT97006.1 DUF308 domain-containing protein [Allobaculum mucilyticum]
MKRYLFNPSTKDSLVLGLLYLICGLALCFCQGSLLVTIVRIIGIIAIVFGCWEMYVYFGLHKSTDMSPMIMGIPALIVGLIFAFFPQMVINFFPVVAGILFIINSITQIQGSLVMRSYQMSGWIISLVIGLCTLALGLFLVMRPASFINALMMITGIGLICEAVVLVVDAFILRKTPHNKR